MLEKKVLYKRSCVANKSNLPSSAPIKHIISVVLVKKNSDLKPVFLDLHRAHIQSQKLGAVCVMIIHPLLSCPQAIRIEDMAQHSG